MYSLEQINPLKVTGIKTSNLSENADDYFYELNTFIYKNCFHSFWTYYDITVLSGITYTTYLTGKQLCEIFSRLRIFFKIYFSHWIHDNSQIKPSAFTNILIVVADYKRFIIFMCEILRTSDW